MLRYIFLFLLSIHGLIHLLGFFKAYQIGQAQQLTKEISRPAGSIWLLTTVLFLVAAVLFMMDDRFWPLITIIAVVLSQILIFMVWQDARFGALANVIILLVAIQGFGRISFERSYQQDVQQSMERAGLLKKEILTEEDLSHLPNLVQNYLRLVGVVGEPKVIDFKIKFEGQMREKGKDWFSFTSEQNNFLDEPERFFFMKARVKGLPTAGYHAYKEDEAQMTIKLLSLFPVVDIRGPELLRAETVTLFNDMCLFAPAALIDEQISWETIDSSSVKAIFTANDISISAVLHFNDKGELVNFVSDDRYSVDDMQQYRFSTPAGNYQMINGHYLPTYGEAVWHYPDGMFTYGKFNLKYLEYNNSLP